MADHREVIDKLFEARKGLSRRALGAFNRGVYNCFMAMQAAEETGESFEEFLGYLRGTPLETPDAVVAYQTAISACRRAVSECGVVAHEASDLGAEYFRLVSLLNEYDAAYNKDAFADYLFDQRKTTEQAFAGFDESPRLYLDIADMGISDYFVAARFVASEGPENFATGLEDKARKLKQSGPSVSASQLLRLAYARGIRTCEEANERYPIPPDAEAVADLEVAFRFRLEEKRRENIGKSKKDE